jgi:hypothetical protein
MCGGEALDHRPPQAAQTRHPTMDAPVVHRHVGNAVPAHAGGDRHEPRPAVDVVAHRERGEHDRGEPEWVRVVQLEPASPGLMMAEMHPDTGPVHQPAVDRVRDRLHRRERRGGDQERAHRSER